MKTQPVLAFVTCCFCLLSLLSQASAQEVVVGRPEAAPVSPRPTPPSASQIPTAGLGVVLGHDADGFFAAGVIPDTVAAASKLIQTGDRILGIAEANQPVQPLAGKSVLEAVALIRGAAGTQVRLSVAPGAGEVGGPGKPMELLLTRGDLGFRAAGPEAGAQAPDLSYLRLGDGQTVSLASAHRGKILVLELWATWCGPCQPAVTELQQTAAQFAAQKDKIEFLALNTDSWDDVEEARIPAIQAKVKEHIQKKGWTQTIQGWAPSKALRPWSIRRWPSLHIIGPDGKIIAHDPEEDLEEVLTELLKK